MSSNFTVRLLLTSGGQALTFAQPFTIPFLETEETPSFYEVTVAAASTAVLWDGAPLPPTYDFLAVIADLDVDVEFVVDGGEADEYHFTVPVRAGGFPLVMPGGTAFAGQAGTQDSFTSGTRKNITAINVHNANTTDAATVSVFIARASV